ncbi:MAG: bifunctional precorrin-2 dehydrogenase/sirohydrochlorin ferrochelatase [Planctomycetota bacterium]
MLLNIETWPVLVVGGGTVAARKAEGLLEHGARVTMVSPEFGDVPAEVIRIVDRFNPVHLAGKRMVFAATNRADVNDAVCKAARDYGVLCNRADPGEGQVRADFSTPPHRTDGDITITATTGSPALSKRLLDELRPDPRIAAMARVMAELRPWIIEHVPLQDRRALFRRLVRDDALDAATVGFAAVRRLVDQHIR